MGIRSSCASAMPVSGDTLSWIFRGIVQGDGMAGTVDLGEYGSAAWTAHRTESTHQES